MNIRYILIGFALLIVLGLVLLASLTIGPHEISFGEIFQILIGNGNNETYNTVILDLRLPRILMGLIAGGILTLGGFFMQALVRNPLADPYIMGISTGAGFGVNLVILGLIPLASLTFVTYPLFAFLGGCLSLALVLSLGISALKEDSARLLIAGIAVSSLFTALTGVLIYKFAADDQIRQILFWSFGSLAHAGWDAVGMSAFFLAIGWVFGIAISSKLDVLLLGDEQAGSLGLSVRNTRLMILGMTVLIVGGSIAFTGPIGFVGMMVPHFSRGINKTAHRKNIIFGTLLGGIYLCGCDLISQIVHPPAGLPIGIVTAILGVPFFLYLLFASKTKI